MHKLALFGAAALLSVGCAYAEDTTVIHRDAAPGIGVTVGAPAVEHRTTVVAPAAPCQHTTVHKENDLGDSKTVKKTEC
ncbi:MAG TPA: hypothetical protein VHR44_10655 [Beijerinckiaceae bacterium]|jgi:hypothetical protein|nr:hypothetical protein [Beijerinckiaceae bacterium]